MNREEAIKRFQLMKKILSIPNSDAARTIEAIDMAIEALSDRPTGEWVDAKGTPTNEMYSVNCSECGEWSEYRTNYCGACGCYMGGEDNAK